MASFSGRKVAVGIGLETVRGTAVAPTYFFPALESKYNDKVSSLLNESIYGTIIKNNEKDTVLIEGEGSFSIKPYIKAMYYALALAFGQKATTTDVVGDTVAKKHSFGLLDTNEHLSATLALRDPNNDSRFAYAMLDSMSLVWAPGEYTKIELAFKSRASVAATNVVAYVSDEKEFLPKHAMLRIADNLAGLDAANAISGIKSFTLKLTKGVKAQACMSDGVVESTTYADLFNTEFEASGSIEKYYKDTTYRAMALNDTVKAMRFSMTDSVNKAGTTTPTSLVFDMSRVAFKGYEPNYGKSDIATEKLDFDVLLDKTDFTKTIVAILTNKYTYA